VRVGRLRTGELLALTGAALLAATLVLRWFSLETTTGQRPAYASLDLPARATSQLGWFVVAVCVAAVVLAVVWLLFTLGRQQVGPTMQANVLLVVAAALAFALVLLRLAIDQPDLGADLPPSAVGIEPAAWLGLLGSALLLVGAWKGLADERLDAPESVYEPPPARPAPPREADVA
jgi:hypothetical protein